MSLNEFNLSTNVCFYKYAHNSGTRGSPDMILTAFDVKFNEKQNELPPEACRPSNKPKKNNVVKVDPQKGDHKYKHYIKIGLI